MKARSFPKQARLTLRAEFIRMKTGAVTHTGVFVFIDCKPNMLGYCRLGITVSRKFGKAVLRNRFKRAVREAFRHFDWQSRSFDIHVRPRAKAVEAKSSMVRKEVFQLLSNPRFG